MLIFFYKSEKIEFAAFTVIRNDQAEKTALPPDFSPFRSKNMRGGVSSQCAAPVRNDIQKTEDRFGKRVPCFRLRLPCPR